MLRHCLFVCFLQGKFIRINFDVAGYIVGANIETCILIPGLKVFSSSTVRLRDSPHLPRRVLCLSCLCSPFWLYFFFWLYWCLFMPAGEKSPWCSLLPTSNHKKKNIWHSSPLLVSKIVGVVAEHLFIIWKSKWVKALFCFLHQTRNCS